MSTPKPCPQVSAAILRYDDVAELHNEMVDELQGVIGTDAKFTRRQLLKATEHRLPEAIRKAMCERVGPVYAKWLPRYAKVQEWSTRAANDVYHHSSVETVEPIAPGQPLRYRFILRAGALQ
jgi:hypothetical protein